MGQEPGVGLELGSCILGLLVVAPMPVRDIAPILTGLILFIPIPIFCRFDPGPVPPGHGVGASRFRPVVIEELGTRFEVPIAGVALTDLVGARIVGARPCLASYGSDISIWLRRTGSEKSSVMRCVSCGDVR